MVALPLGPFVATGAVVVLGGLGALDAGTRPADSDELPTGAVLLLVGGAD